MYLFGTVVSGSHGFIIYFYNAFFFSHMACQEERAEIAVTLAENGANLYIQNKVREPYN